MQDFHNCRRYDVDWLRVLAFITLIFYHIGMFYVSDWGWHVKSQYQSEGLQYIMLLVNQWRMLLIFFISGFALCMVEAKVSSIRLLKIRFFRVHIPLIIGMYLVIPPQAYYEAVEKFSYMGNYLSFWLEYINPFTNLLPEMHQSSLGMLTWNHLWYLMYFWVYTLVYLILKPILIRVGLWVAQTSLSAFTIFLIPALILTIYGLWFKLDFPKTHALFDDWYNHAIYFSVFMFGYLIAKSGRHWQTIVDSRCIWLTGALVGYAGLLILYKTDWLSFSGFAWNVAIQFWVDANAWFWLLSVVGFAGYYLNNPSPILNYLNEAILPWYILHQTITIVVAMNLSPYSLGGLLEVSLVVVGTFVSCTLLYEIIRRWNISRFMFGMKLNLSPS